MSPAVTAVRSSCSPRAKRASGSIPFWVASAIHASRQRVVFAWGQILFTELRRVWAQLDTAEAVAYEDKLAAQVHVLEDATASLDQLSRTLGRSCRRLKRHLRSLSS